LGVHISSTSRDFALEPIYETGPEELQKVLGDTLVYVEVGAKEAVESFHRRASSMPRVDDGKHLARDRSSPLTTKGNDAHHELDS
jgi:hypothetical protein